MSARAEIVPSLVERIKQTMVGLKMPRAIEILDATVRRLERGEMTALEAIDALLTELDFGQNLNGLAIDQGAKHGVHQFLYGHGQAETARKIAVVSTYPANALSPALSKLAKVELSNQIL